MPTLIFIDSTGATRKVDAALGQSVMEAAKQHGVVEIVAECGGQCACATCHVFVEPHWFSKTGPISDLEQDLLSFNDDLRETSRLACQIQVTNDIDGMIVHTPSKQG